MKDKYMYKLRLYTRYYSAVKGGEWNRVRGNSYYILYMFYSLMIFKKMGC